MHVNTGTRLGPYEIVSRIGAGGMGEVFRARDTRLDRSVAIKVLPSEFASNSQLKQRFEREARSISQLNHPHICTLYDVGSHDGVEYLVMELIEGETLADRIARGPLPLMDVLKYGAQIAEALHVAHRAGIVHRDLKPGNVMITKSGAKLLDFGLARDGSVSQAPMRSPSGLTEEATAYKPLTAEGTILGTFQYMAPEQLEGVEADARTDIFALGCVVYEMLTGKRAFEGKTRTSLIAAIVGSEPRPINELQPLTPAALEHVVKRCLSKDPDERWQSAYDVAKELEWISQAGSQSGVAAPLTRRSRARVGMMTALIVALVGMSALAAWLYGRRASGVMIESTILPPEGYVFSVGLASIAAAPDGSALAVVLTDSKGARSLAVRPLSAAGYRFLAGTDEAVSPFWSADSRRIGFFAGGRLKVVDAAGGPVESVADAPVPRGAAWAADGTIVFAPSIRGPLMRVPPSGGTPVPATTLAEGEISHRLPAFFPDSDRFVFTALLKTTAQIIEGSLDDRSSRRLLIADSEFAQPARDGWLLYVRGGNRSTPSLVAQKLNRQRQLTGAVALVADNVGSIGSGGGMMATADGTGNLFFSRGVPYELSELAWVDRSGRELERVGERAVYFTPSLSRDGRRLAVDVSDPTTGLGDVWIHDLARKRVARLTYDAGNESSPLWTTDDKRIVYVGDPTGIDDLYQISAGGTGGGERLYADDRAKRPTAISNDGRFLLFNVAPTRTARAIDIWLYSFTDKTARAWLATPFSELGATLSPDGKWIAYQSDETGRAEIYVRAFPESDEKWPVSTTGGSMPAWRGDGRELYYVDGSNKMMAVKVNPGASFEAEAPVELFGATLRDHPARQYDVSSDGTRFLLNRVSEHAAPQPVTLVQNWTARLRQ